MPSILSLDEALIQPEKPDPAMNMTPPTDGGTPYDFTILQDLLGLASSVLGMAPERVAIPGTVVGVFSLISSLLTIAELDDSETSSQIDDAATRTYLSNLSSTLTGMQNNVTNLKGLDPVAQAATYKTELVSFNAVLTTEMPQFMQDTYRREAMTLFMTAAGIHLSVLRQLIEATRAEGPQVWVNALRSSATAYAQWLSDTKQAIINQRISEIDVLQGSEVVWVKDSFHDHRLVDGDSTLVDVSPATTAPATRTAYIGERVNLFLTTPWMQNIDQCILNWKQTSKLCDRNSTANFAGTPSGAVFPQIGFGGSYVDLADYLAWPGPNQLSISVGGTWQNLTGSLFGQPSARIDVITQGGPVFNITNAPPANAGIPFKLLVHLSSIGDVVVQNNQFGGTRGQGRRLEGFQITIDPPIQDLGCRYMAHLQNIGDVPWVDDGQFVGTRGQSRRLEGFALLLTGPAAANYNVFYMAHLQNIGDTAFFSNGEFCGTRGQAGRVEGMLVCIQPK